MAIHVSINDCGILSRMDAGAFKVPFVADNYGFFVLKDDVQRDIALCADENGYSAAFDGLHFRLAYELCEDHLKIHVRIENRGDDFDGRIGFHMGVDTWMESWPQWNDSFFPTLLRCEKTHLWGYYMNTAENALAVATSGPVASYDIQYNMTGDPSVHDDLDCGHRIPGTDILFYQNTILPQRHPQHLRIMKAGEIYENTLYMIPVAAKADIKQTLSCIAGIPLVDAEKYTKEPGEKLDASILCSGSYTRTLLAPDGSSVDASAPLSQPGLYQLCVQASNGRQCEASFFIREPWDHYLHHAALNALAKPPKASTHTESFYGLFSTFLYYKHTRDEAFGAKAYEAFEESMQYMFDMDACKPITIPHRIQNISCFISLLVDMYEANPAEKLHYLEKAAKFAELVMAVQDETGAYRNRGTHYTCVVYVAKSMLELALAERACGVPALLKKSEIHYASARRAVDDLVRSLDNIQTEGEMTLEDGMISCSALQIAMFALTLPESERAPYTAAAEYMMKVHSCLEQQLIPDCRCNGASLRYWESQYDVMIRVNMLNSPHGWTGWTAYGKYYLYLLTGKKEYLLSLMNVMGSCSQLIDETGDLRWAFCSQPYVRGRSFVPDYEQEVKDGYRFVDTEKKAYRGKYVMKEYSEQYIDMISDWYRIGEQKVVGGYAFCPLILDGWSDTEADRQGGCCDNDVHEVFKCMEETVLGKAFVHENDDGTLLTYGCAARIIEGRLEITLTSPADQLVYCLKTPCVFGTAHIKGIGIAAT
ncbi:MAG: hypothetical protein E7463_10325 [Ruminococcaceae bacterium]|nr:hypothetical protein [Oscillospiraceae bacterium]